MERSQYRSHHRILVSLLQKVRCPQGSAHLGR
ncbi:hypothetical protein L915_15960 [Phytophthora nicotianae]|uniref:Uncharacterized protein n=1 Tax=Phytophthora nicotianae TaxID=4792 RepID=W2IDF9_PHYNI|nr:hypothetical protein L915_15960 [Phytophthora nicotianae]ETL31403.1 hypothetical protein L916_15856 [Phytophthora nicotianae]